MPSRKGRSWRTPDHLPVPVDAERAQVVELTRDELLAHAADVEVLDPHQEPGAARPGEQPGEQRRPQVAEMEIPVGEGA